MYNNNSSFDAPNQGDPVASFRYLFSSRAITPNVFNAFNAFNDFYESLPTKSASRICSFIHLTATRDNINNIMNIFQNVKDWQIEHIINGLLMHNNNEWLNNDSTASLAASCLANLNHAFNIITKVLGDEGNERIAEYKSDTIRKIPYLFENLNIYNPSTPHILNFDLNKFSVSNLLLDPKNFKSQDQFSTLLKLSPSLSPKWIDDLSAVEFVYTQIKNSFQDFDCDKTNAQILKDIKDLYYKEQIIYALNRNYNYRTVLGYPALSHKDKNIRSKAIYYMEQTFLMMNEPACNVFSNAFLFITDTEKMQSEYDKIISENPQLLRKPIIIDGNTPKIKGLHQVEEALCYIEKSTDSSQIRALSTSAIEYINCIKNIRTITDNKARDIKEKILDVAMHSISKLENQYHNHSSNVRSI